MNSKKHLAKKTPELQKAYLNEILLKRVNGYKSVIKRILDDMPSSLNKVERITNDSLIDDIKKKLENHINSFKKIFNEKMLKKSVNSFINNKLLAKNKAQFKHFAKANKGMNNQITKLSVTNGISLDDIVDNASLQGFIKNAISQNVELIKTMDTKVFEDIKTLVYQNIAQGSTKTKLSESLLNLGAKSRKKAEQIAKDQTNKINENINNQRVQALGATHFEWMTTGRENVRSEHDSFDGKTYSYKKGAGSRGILPGQDVNCQCTAIPIFKDN
jgi:SPP1 gp7 family putative phage head morphogenesis protein